jgi:hypothetical protein
VGRLEQIRAAAAQSSDEQAATLLALVRDLKPQAFRVEVQPDGDWRVAVEGRLSDGFGTLLRTISRDGNTQSHT